MRFFLLVFGVLLAFLFNNCGYHESTDNKTDEIIPVDQGTGSSINVNKAVGDVVFKLGSEIDVSVNIDGDDLTYQWSINGSPIGTDSNRLQIQTATSRHHGELIVKVTDRVGHSVQLKSTLHVAHDSCKAFVDAGINNGSGNYYVTFMSLTPYKVFCDMETDGGGWTLAMQSGDGINGNDQIDASESYDYDDFRIFTGKYGVAPSAFDTQADYKNDFFRATGKSEFLIRAFNKRINPNGVTVIKINDSAPRINENRSLFEGGRRAASFSVLNGQGLFSNVTSAAFGFDGSGGSEGLIYLCQGNIEAELTTRAGGVGSSDREILPSCVRWGYQDQSIFDAGQARLFDNSGQPTAAVNCNVPGTPLSDDCAANQVSFWVR